MTQAEFDRQIAVCVAHDDWDAVLQTLEQGSLSQVPSTYTACLEACWTAKNPGSALEILQAMSQAGFSPTRNDYGLAVRTLCFYSKHDSSYIAPEHWREALRIVQEEDLEFDNEIYESVLECLTRVKQWKASIRLLYQLEKKGQVPTLTCYSTVIECCVAANQSEQALKILQSCLNHRDYLPSPTIFESIVVSFSQKLQWRRAIQVVQLMDDRKVPKTLQLYNALLTSCAKAKEVVQAKNLLKQMRQKHGIAPNIRSFNAVLSACASTRRWRDALDVLDQCHLEPGVEPDIYTYTNVIRACAKGGKTQRALTLLQVAKDKGLKVDTFCYTAAIEACAKAKLWRNALDLLDEMAEHGVEPSEVTYSVAITACGNGGEWRKALELLELMRGKNMAINLITYNAAITALSKAAKQATRLNNSDDEKLWIKAMNLLERMKADGIEPDGFSFCSTISCCGCEGQWQEALDLIEIMQEGGPRTRPNRIAYTAAIASCGRSGQVDHAVRLFRQMREQGLSPDRVSYNALFAALRKCKKSDMAIELWDEMVNNAKENQLRKVALARAYSSTTPDIITVTDAIGAISHDDSNTSREKVDEIFAEAVRRKLVLRPGTLDSANEVDLSGMSLPVARAACRYILNRVRQRSLEEIGDLTLITGVGASKTHAPNDIGSSRTTTLREYVQEILLTDFRPPLESTVPPRAQGTVVVDRSNLLRWKN